MLECRSIYLGGNLIAAIDCDYDSSRDLGLICPFCDQPVFLVRGSEKRREKSGVTYSVAPHFNHYSASEGEQCEARSKTTEGQKWLDEIRIERHNQRLDLFNNHFWDMVRNSHDYPKNPKANISEFELKSLADNVREWWNKHPDQIRDWISQSMTVFTDPQKALRHSQNIARKLDVESGVKCLLDLFHTAMTVDMKLHEQICNEASDFLKTKKSGIALQKMISAILHKYPDLLKMYHKANHPDVIAVFLVGQIAMTRWNEEFERLNKSSKKGFK